MPNSPFKRRDLPEILPVGRGGTGTNNGSINGSDDIVLTPAVNKIIKMNSDTQFLGNLLPDLTDTRSIGSSTKFFKDQFVSQINATIFAENTISLLGGWFVVGKNQVKLPAITSAQTQIDFGTLMTPNDFLVIKSHDASGTIKVEYMQIGTLVSGTTYNVTRDIASMHVTDPIWADGTPALVLGTTGDGRIELNAYDSPRISIIQQGAAYNSQTEVIRLGDLNGIGGISTQKFGIYVGTANNHMQYNSTDDSLIVTGTIKATAGYIGGTSSGWAIGSNILSGGTGSTYIALDQANSKIRIGAKATLTDANTGVHLGSDGLALGASSVFKVTAAGVLTASSATITGVINANTGYLGGATNYWSITAGLLTSVGTASIVMATASSTIKVGAATTIDLGAGIFMDGNGNFRAGTATAGTDFIKATTTALTIKASTFNLYTTTLKISSTPYISLGATTPTSATVGTGIWIDGTGLYGLSANTQNFKIDATNGNVTAIAGSIAGWTIDSQRIYKTGSGFLVSGYTGYIGLNTANSGSGQFYDGSQKLIGFQLGSNQGGEAYTIVVGQMMATASTLKTGYYGIQMMSSSSNEFFALGMNSNVSGGTYNRIAGWTFDSAKIHNATGTLDGTTYTTTGMVLGSSGYIASPKFRVTTGGILYATEANISGVITATSGTFTGTVNASGGNFTGNVTIGTNASKITIASTAVANTTAIYSGTGTYGNTNTGFFMDASGRFSLKDKLTWDGTTLTINGGGTFSGALSAASGSFAGSLSAVTGTLGALTVNGTLTLGTGTIASTNFNVTSAGVVTATSATITGTINATGGYFGTSSNGWNISSNTITANGTGLFQTSASANTGIKINSTAIAGYNGTVQTLNLATDGSGWVGLTGTRAIEWTTAGAVKAAGWNLDAGKLYNAASAGAVYTGINSTVTGANKVFYTGATAADGTGAKAYINADGSGAVSSGYLSWDNSGNLTVGSTATGDNNVYIAALGALQFRNATTVLGQLDGSTWTLGQAGEARVEITNTAVDLYDGAATPIKRIALTTTGLIIGKADDNRIEITDSAFSLYEGTAEKINIASTGITTYGDNSTTYTTVNASGLTVVDNSVTAATLTSATVTLYGASSNDRIVLDATGASIYSNNVLRASALDTGFTAYGSTIYNKAEVVAGGMNIYRDVASAAVQIAIFGATTVLGGNSAVTTTSTDDCIRIDSTGVKIFESTNNRVELLSTGLAIYESNVEKASFGANTVITGGTITIRNTTNNNDKIVLAQDSFKVYDNNTEVASFGATTTIGTTGSTTPYLEMTSSTLKLKNNTTDFISATTTGITVTGVINANTGYIGGTTNGWQILAGEIRAAGTGKFTTSSTTTRVEIDGTGFKAYNAGAQRVQILNDGSGWLGSSSDFSWTNAGVLSVNKVTATSGTIAGWSIDSGKIYSSNTFIANTSSLWSDQSSRISAAVHSHDFGTATYSPALSGSYSGTGSTGSVATYVAPANGYWKLLTDTAEVAWSRVTSTAMTVTAGTRYMFEFTLSKPSGNPQAVVIVDILNSSDVVLYSTTEIIPSNYTYTYKIVYTPAVTSIKVRWTLQTSEQSSEVRLSLLTIKSITPFVELSNQGLFIYTDPTTMTKLGAGLVDISSIKNTFNFNASSINAAFDYVNFGIRTANDVYNEPYKIDSSNSTYPLMTLLGNGANGTYAAIRLFSTDSTYGHSVIVLERPNRTRLSATIHKSGVSEYNTQWVVGTGLDNSGNNSLGWGVSQDVTLASTKLFISRGGTNGTSGYVGLGHTVPVNRLTLYGGTTAAEGIGFSTGSATAAADTVLYRGAAGQLVLEGTDADLVLNSPTSTVRSQVTFKDNGTAKAYFGVSFSTNGLVNGSADGDFCVRTQGGKILLSVDSGTTSELTISSTGVTIADTLFFGSAADTNLYRSAANTLKTDDALIVTGSLTTAGFPLCRWRGELSTAPTTSLLGGDTYYHTGEGNLYMYVTAGGGNWIAIGTV